MFLTTPVCNNMAGKILEICPCRAAKLDSSEEYNFSATQFIKSINTEHDLNYECMTDTFFFYVETVHSVHIRIVEAHLL